MITQAHYLNEALRRQDEIEHAMKYRCLKQLSHRHSRFAFMLYPLLVRAGRDMVSIGQRLQERYSLSRAGNIARNIDDQPGGPLPFAG